MTTALRSTFSRGFAAILLASTAAACASPGATAPPRGALQTYDARPDEQTPRNVLGLPLKTGQLVLTEAPGDLSFVFNLIPSQFFRFTHAAILVFEDGEPFVYDIAGEVSTFQALFADRPTDVLYGKVRRNPFFQYVRQNYYTEIYDPPEDVDPEKVAAFLQENYKNETPFDPYFDHLNREQLYCAQLVSMALEAGGGAPMKLTRNTDNPSMRKILDWLEISDNGALPAGRFADPERYRGAAGTFPSRTAVRAYYATKQVVYERFTKDQKLGNVFKLDGFDITLRPEVDNFVKQAIKVIRSEFEPLEARGNLADERYILIRVREIADEVLGPFRPDGAQGS